MSRKTVSVNFDNDVEIYDYVKAKENASDFIRDSIREKVNREKDEIQVLEKMIERVVMRCLNKYRMQDIRTNTADAETEALKAAASFFED